MRIETKFIVRTVWLKMTIHQHFEVIKKTGRHFFSSTKHPSVNVRHFDQQMAEKSIN